MNICTPGNCICDTREWEGDTDCFGNTAEDDLRLNEAEGARLWCFEHMESYCVRHA